MPNPIRFRFDLDKTAQAIAYMLARIGTTDKVKLTKLVYLADREHFIAHGYPITGDDQYAMPKGPCPSATLDALDGDYAGSEEKLFRFIHIDDYRISLKPEPAGTASLTDEERGTLDRIVQIHGKKPKWTLVDETHQLPEYVATYRPNTSTLIPYEVIARHSGSDARFRMNRPVISREAAARMDCPYPREEGI